MGLGAVTARPKQVYAWNPSGEAASMHVYADGVDHQQRGKAAEGEADLWYQQRPADLLCLSDSLRV